MRYIPSIRFTILSVLILFVSACGGGGGGSSTSSSTGSSGTDSSGGGSTANTMDATGLEIVAALLSPATKASQDTSSSVAGATTGSSTSRIDMVPVMSGGTLMGMTVIYVEHTTPGSYGGATVLNGTVDGSGDASGGDAQSRPGMTRRFDGIMSESGKWRFDGTVDVEMSGSLFGGSSPFMIGHITDTMVNSGALVITNMETGEVYLFDEYNIVVQLSGDAIQQNVSCAADGVSVIVLHKASGGSQMTCAVNSDCTGCIN